MQQRAWKDLRTGVSSLERETRCTRASEVGRWPHLLPFEELVHVHLCVCTRRRTKRRQTGKSAEREHPTSPAGESKRSSVLRASSYDTSHDTSYVTSYDSWLPSFLTVLRARKLADRREGAPTAPRGGTVVLRRSAAVNSAVVAGAGGSWCVAADLCRALTVL